MTTFTQEQLDAAIAEAVSKATTALQSELDELKGQTAEQQTAAAVAAAVAEKDTALTELQSKLDAATLEAAETKKAHDELVTLLETTEAANTAKAEADARKDARLEEVRAAELAFTDEWLTENADRLAAMSDEDWAVQLDSWKVLANKVSDDTIPAKTGLHAAREGDGGQGGGRSTTSGFAVSGGALRELRESRAMDPRTL